MANNKKGHQYWGEKQELLCRQWTTATTQSELTRIHNALLPQVNYMCETIIQRYFAVPTSQRMTELKKDAVQHLFLTLDKYQPDRSKSGSYAFCGMVIKRFVYDAWVLKRDHVRNTDNVTESIDDYHDHHTPIDYGENSEIDIEAVLSHFKGMIKKVEDDMEVAKIIAAKNRNKPKLTGYKNKIKVLEKCMEYIERFESINLSCMADYVYLSLEDSMNKTSVIYWFKRLFNFTTKLKLELSDEGKADERYNYMDDDYTPDESIWHKRQMKKKFYNKNGNYSYF